MYALGHEEVWGCLCTLRKSEHTKIEGGIIGLFAKIIELFRGTHDIKLIVVPVALEDTYAHILADVPAVIV